MTKRDEKILNICKHDCFNCPFPDCKLNYITESDSSESKLRDKLIKQSKGIKLRKNKAVNKSEVAR